jgi:beta-lactamase class A
MPARAVLALAVACAVIAVGVVVVLAVHGPSSHPPRQSAAGDPAASSPAGHLNATTSAPMAKQATPSPRPKASQGRQDPFGTAAASLVSGRAGTVQAAVYDVRTGQAWQLGLSQPQAEASVVKLDVLETLLAERSQDGGTGLTAEDRSLTEQMIEDSDNRAATSLWNEVGGPSRIRAFNAKAGLTGTSPSPCVVCAGFPWPGWGLTTTTAADQVALLRQLIAPGPLLTSADRDYALSLMENVTPSQRWGVSGGVPAQVKVALKNGWLPLKGASDWQINSVGWISGGDRDYLMAVLTTGNPSEQYGIDTIDRLAAIVWQDMG